VNAEIRNDIRHGVLDTAAVDRLWTPDIRFLQVGIGVETLQLHSWILIGVPAGADTTFRGRAAAWDTGQLGLRIYMRELTSPSLLVV